MPPVLLLSLYLMYRAIPRCSRVVDPECACLRLAWCALEESAEDDCGVFAKGAITWAEGGGDV
jgi:hypothetical protein